MGPPSTAFGRVVDAAENVAAAGAFGYAPLVLVTRRRGSASGRARSRPHDDSRGARARLRRQRVAAGLGRAGGHRWTVRPRSSRAASPAPASPAGSASPVRATLDRYCVTCHNDRLRTGGLTLASLDPARVSSHADVWERVVRKLRTREMPPAGLPRPDEAAYVTAVAALEAALDAEAAARPQPGRVAVHRLSRTEYANAVRDLLGIELPAQVLLPADEPDQQTFDNVASVLSVSPALIENYLSAAYRVSRLAVADPSAPLAVETYTVPMALTQDERVSDDLPFGTQGGIAFRHQFPATGDYTITVTLRRAALSLHHRHGRTAPDRRAARRRTAEAVHDRRGRPGHDGARELCRQHAGRSAVGGLHAHRRRWPAGACPGHRGCPRRERVVRAPLLGARGHPAAATTRVRADDERAVSRSPRGRHRGRRRTDRAAAPRRSRRRQPASTSSSASRRRPMPRRRARAASSSRWPRGPTGAR